MFTLLRLLILTYCSCYLSVAACSPGLPKQARIPGGVAILELAGSEQQPPPVYYQDKRVMLLPAANNKWYAIIGIPITAQPGTHSVKIHTTAGTQLQQFTVRNKSYPEQRLTITDQRKVQPLAEDLAIIEAQYLETIQTYDHWQHQAIDSAILHLPVNGRKSSPFGLTRIMNKIPLNPHSGLDIAAPKGTLVSVAKAGTVINIGEYFYSGKIVFVDHGQGFITSYCHLDTILVKQGQELKAGATLGTIGNTGRATGPHLHWSVSLNGVRVDPQLFIYE